MPSTRTTDGSGENPGTMGLRNSEISPKEPCDGDMVEGDMVDAETRTTS